MAQIYMAQPTQPPPLGIVFMTQKTNFRLFARLRNHFLAGVLVVTPIVVTITFAEWLFTFINTNVMDLFPELIDPNRYMTEVLGLPFGIPGLGVIVMFVGVTLIGAMTPNIIGRWIIRAGEKLVNRVPLLNSLYNLSKQMMETVLRQDKNAFKQAVLIEYPRQGTWAIGFITADTQPEIKTPLTGAKTNKLTTGDTLVNLFIPTSPNPTSGFVIITKQSDLIPMDCTVEEAIKLVISGGIIGKDKQRKSNESN